VLAAVAALAVATAPAPASADEPRAPRIVGGTEVAIEDAPFQAGLVVTQGPRTSTRCGGTILTPTRVATAAHCLRRLDTGAPVAPSAVQVRAATARIDDPAASQQRRTASAFALHPAYDGPYFDAAVITLDAPLDLSGPKARAIALTDPSDAADAEPGDLATVTGWGQTSSPGPTSPVLRAVAVPLVSDLACSRAYGAFRARRCSARATSSTAARTPARATRAVPSSSVPAGPEARGHRLDRRGLRDRRCPGVYTEVSDPAVRSFLAGEPVRASDPALVGVGTRPACAAMDDGQLPPPPPPPAPAPAPPAVAPPRAGPRARPARAPAPGAPRPPPCLPAARAGAARHDAPVASVRSASCARGRCTYRRAGGGSGVSAGVRTLSATFRSRVSRPVPVPPGTCARTLRRTVRSRDAGPRSWRLSVRDVPAGRHTLRVVAQDAAGLRSRPATRVARTRGR
jgi:hypothetical protein